ncbi:MAG TPA: YegS/Rv2252/BmrU family lipid kinase [Candidatus Pygmaiobacter gallistercoris]|nr:YegS/Rv2252/BmrU family lipid kinase [Candidatus Pygmaiobacter gallistercoris]
MKHVFIVNPRAGKADASQFFVPSLIERIAPLKLDYAVEITTHPGHATEITKQYAMTRDPVRFYACGGDGTLNEVFAGAYRYPQAEVACVPLGSGNDFLRNFGTQEDFLRVEDSIAGKAISIDLMQVGEHEISAAICSIGLDAAVAYGIPKYRRLPFCGGTMAYNISIVENICKPIGCPMTVTVDGRRFTGNFLLVAVANGMTYGGGYKAAPRAKLDDGLLEVLMVKKISRFKIAGVIGKYQAGEHFDGDAIRPELRDIITYLRGEEIDIRAERTAIANVDGECGPRDGLHVRVLPHAARFVLPAPLAAKTE